MKTLILNITATTQEFNLFGKIITYSILGFIVLSASALFIDVIHSAITGRPIQFIY